MGVAYFEKTVGEMLDGPWWLLFFDDQLGTIAGQKEVAEAEGFCVTDVASLGPLKKNFTQVSLLFQSDVSLKPAEEAVILYQVLVIDMVIEGLTDLTAFEMSNVRISKPGLAGPMLLKHVVANHLYYRSVPIILLTEHPQEPEVSNIVNDLRQKNGMNIFILRKEKRHQEAEFKRILEECKAIIKTEVVRKVRDLFEIGVGKRDRYAIMLNGIAINYTISNQEWADILGIERNGSENVDAIRRGYVIINSKDIRERINLFNEILGALRTHMDRDEVIEYIRDSSKGTSLLARLRGGNRAVFFQIKREMFDRTGGVWS
jgi:hypothetical protein